MPARSKSVFISVTLPRRARFMRWRMSRMVSAWRRFGCAGSRGCAGVAAETGADGCDFNSTTFAARFAERLILWMAFLRTDFCAAAAVVVFAAVGEMNTGGCGCAAAAGFVFAASEVIAGEEMAGGAGVGATAGAVLAVSEVATADSGVGAAVVVLAAVGGVM